MYGTFWALVPPIVAIALALITKEVYSSLFIGIVVGGLFWSNFNFSGTFEHVIVDGIIGSLSDSWNVGILVFLVVLGAVVALMNILYPELNWLISSTLQLLQSVSSLLFLPGLLQLQDSYLELMDSRFSCRLFLGTFMHWQHC